MPIQKHHLLGISMFLAPMAVPQGERRAVAQEHAEGNGGRGGGHEGGEGQGDEHLVSEMAIEALKSHHSKNEILRSGDRC